MILRVARRSSAVYSTRGVFVAAWLDCNISDDVAEPPREIATPRVRSLRVHRKRAGLEPEAEPRSRAGYAGVARREVGVRDMIDQRRDIDYRRYLVAEFGALAKQHPRPQQLAAGRGHRCLCAGKTVMDGAAEAAIDEQRTPAEEARQQRPSPG